MSGYVPTAGEAIAGYRIDALAGRGGMGEVYRAWDERLGRYVALKLLAPRLADDERFRERFLRESRLAAAIDHPNVIPVYEAGEADGRLYIAMRYVEGSDLRRLLTDERVLEPERALSLLAPVAGALDAAHARGLVHRDVKPGNVLIAVEAEAAPPEHVYVSDFGLTTLFADPADAGGPFSGTADYAAPELVTGGPVDGRADIYALGCMLFESLTGTPPYGGDSVLAILWGHVNDPVPAASARNPDLPAAIDGVLRKALAKEPGDRFASGRALIDSARDALGVSGIEVPAVEPRRRLAAVGALGLALVAAGVILGVVLTRGGGVAAGATDGAAVRIDPATNAAGEPVRVGDGPSAVGAGPDGIWIASYHEGTLWRLDPQSLIAARVPSIGAPSGIALHGGRVYVAAEGPSAFSGNVTDYDAPTGQRFGSVELLACSIAAGAEGIWTAGCPDVQRLSTDDKPKILADIPIPFQEPRSAEHDRNELSSMATGLRSVWVLGDAADRRLWRIDPKTARIAATFSLDFSPADVAVGAGGVWLVDQIGDRLVRLDPSTGRVVARIPLCHGARAAAVGAGSVWVACFLDRAVARIDPGTNRVAASIGVAESPRDLAVGGGGVWAVGDAD